MKWLRSRYRNTAYHAAERIGRVYQARCPAIWPASDVTDELASDGVGSGEYATRRCEECAR